MKTLLSRRRQAFYALVHELFHTPAPVLEQFLLDSANTQTSGRARVTRLARLAALRTLACRERTGRVYVDRKRDVRARLGLQAPPRMQSAVPHQGQCEASAFVPGFAVVAHQTHFDVLKHFSTDQADAVLHMRRMISLFPLRTVAAEAWFASTGNVRMWNLR